MTVKEIKELIKDTGYCFDTYHDFSGINDRRRENHNALIKENIRLVAANAKRTKWNVLKVNSDSNPPLTVIATHLNFEDAMKLGDGLSK